jgi:hypothetical protein
MIYVLRLLKILSGFTILLLTLHTSLYANKNEQFPFIGLTMSLDAMHFDDTLSMPKLDKTNIGVRYGRQTVDWRTVFAISGNNDSKSVSMEVDKILSDQLFGMPEFRPYVGGTVGYMHHKEISTQSDDGYYYGGNVGFLL